MTYQEARDTIKSLGYKPMDFRYKRITGHSTSVGLKINAKNPELTARDFAKIERAFPWGKVMVFDSNGTTMDWKYHLTL